MNLALAVLLGCAALGLYRKTAYRHSYIIAFIAALVIIFIYLNFPGYMT